jgi:hypothetical protein
VQDIADWLEKLGMSEHAERFAENRIDLSVLPDLTDQDLEKLGVVLGVRRKMLRAIGKLDYTSAAPSSAPAPAPKAATSTAPLTTETAGRVGHARRPSKYPVRVASGVGCSALGRYAMGLQSAI